MEVRILGALEVAAEGSVLDLGAPRLRLLLALLVLRGGATVSSDRLIEELWEGDPPHTATHTLQGCVYRLRRALGPESWRLETRPTGYRLKISPHELDALRFVELATTGREALAGGEAEMAAGLLEEALGLWRAPVLADLPELVALEPERARLGGMRLTVLEDRVEADLALGRHLLLVEELERLVAEHPFRERLWGQMMVALYRAGRQVEALRAYRRMRGMLGEELGIEPSPWLSRLEEQILLHHEGLGEPAATKLETPNNLPAPRTSFVGRHRELAELAGLLGTKRLVTVTGPPGSGKTRLALEAAARSLQEHPHGVFFVPLAEIDQPDLVVSAIASALGVTTSDRPLLEALIEHATRRRLLLVLDNFEHLVAGAPVVGRLLDAASGVRVLATSRAPLRLSGEQEYPLSPLPVPAPGDLDSAEDPARFDVLALFADRARAVDPHFTLTVDNSRQVADVAARVDGLPLAVELAAARLRLLPLAELPGRLDDAMDVLTKGPTDRPDRQRTLRDAISWSYHLLDPPHQALLRRLAVFRGGFTLDAAEAVASGPPVDDVLEGVSTLVEVSLLQPPNELGKARCSMLETIRAYAVDQLRASGEEEESARRHAGFYVRLIEEAEPELTRAGQVQWVARLEDEHANLVAVLRWSTQTGDTEMGLAMAGRMWRLWQLRGHLAEGRSWLEELLALAGDTPTVPRVKGLIGLAGLQYYQGDWEGAETSYRQALDTLEDLDEWWLQIEALAGLGITIACHKGAPEEAAPVERELQALADRHQDPMAIGFAMATSAMVRLFSGDLEGSRRYNEQVLAACRAFGERWYEGETLRSLALASLLLKRYEEAEEELLAAFDIAREAGALPSVAVDLDRLAWAAMATGRPERAVVLAGAADRLRETVGSQLTAAAGDFTVEGFRWATEDPRQAARDVLTQHEIDLAWARGRSMSPDEAVECTA